MSKRGRVVVLSGPSGVGKTTVLAELSKVPGIRKAVTVTTRPAREGERDGYDYRFVDPRRFQEMIDRGELLEYAEVHGHLYGTPRDEVERALRNGETLVLAIDVQGARALREQGIEGLTQIFLAPPSLEELERRLGRRGTESEEERERRLETAREELKEQKHFDHVVVNDRLESAVDEILGILGFPSRAGEKRSKV